MSLEAVLAAIRQEGDAGARAIEQRALEEVARILKEAEQVREAAQLEADQRALAIAEAERARILQAASLEALRIVGAAQQALVDRVMVQLRDRLSRMRSTPDYPAALRRLLVQATETLGGSLGDGEPVLVHVDPRDRELIAPMLEALALEHVLHVDLTTWGGVRATSADDRVCVDNTLETRLDEVTGYLRRYAPSLFQQDVAPSSTSADET